MTMEGESWFRVGHTTHHEDRTGCTVILFDRLVPARVDVRGGAPGTRETNLLSSEMLVGQLDALVLTGGSAFGLSAADGVVRFLAEQGRGVPTTAGAIPIVASAVLFDLSVGTRRHPDPDDGYAAAVNAQPPPISSGQVGAGTGATVAKLGGASGGDGGLGVGVSTVRGVDVTVILALNAVGDVVDPATGRFLAVTLDPAGRGRTGRAHLVEGIAAASEHENTTIGAVLIAGVVDGRTLARACISAHDALARCVVPAHTLFDGDTFFSVGERVGDVATERLMAICAAVEVATEQAIVALYGGTGGAADV